LSDDHETLQYRFHHDSRLSACWNNHYDNYLIYSEWIHGAGLFNHVMAAATVINEPSTKTRAKGCCFKTCCKACSGEVVV